MKIKVISVRLKSLTDYSDLSYKVTDFNGNSAFIPKSQVHGRDYESRKSTAYWIAEWVLQGKGITYSHDKKGLYISYTGKVEKMPVETIIETHVPERKEPINPQADKSLKR